MNEKIKSDTEIIFKGLNVCGVTLMRLFIFIVVASTLKMVLYLSTSFKVFYVLIGLIYIIEYPVKLIWSFRE